MSVLNSTIATMLQGAIDTLNIVAELYLENTDDNNAIVVKLQSEVQAAQMAINEFLKGDTNGGDVDRLAELVAAITINKTAIEEIIATSAARSPIEDNLTSQAADHVLSARQGYLLKQLIDTLNTTVTQLNTLSHTHTNKLVLDTFTTTPEGVLKYGDKAMGLAPAVFLTREEATALTTWPSHVDSHGIIFIQE